MREQEERKQPALFAEELENAQAKYSISYIPEASIYDSHAEKIVRNPPVSAHKTVTIFGYAPENTTCVLRWAQGHGHISEISYGKNWMDIRYEKESCIYNALLGNGTILNGEMIGAMQKHRRSLGARKYQEIFSTDQKGLLSRLFIYLFGK